MDILFREHAQNIYIYPSLEEISDPFEKNVTITRMNRLPIKAIVSDLTFAKVQYAMPGIETDRAKEIIIENKYENFLKLSYKIRIDGNDYEGWKINGKLQYRIEGEYLRAYVYIKKV